MVFGRASGLGTPSTTMYDLYIMRRTQIYLDANQRERLARRASASGVTSSHLIREAVESYLTTEPDQEIELARQRQSLDEAFSFPPITRLSEGGEYVEMLRSADTRRMTDLERRWRGSA